MSEKFITFALSAMLFALCLPASAQEPAGKISRIGFLSRELHPSDSRAADIPSRGILPPRFA